MITQLELIRKEIDDIDNKILDLISLRLEKINKISQIKNILKVPSYIKEKENDIIISKIINNKRNNISNILINDILKRIMYESYNIENKKIILKNYKKYRILFIGNNTKIEKIFRNLFSNSGYFIYKIDLKNFENKFYRIIKKINVIITCLYEFQFEKILNFILKHIDNNYILINILYNIKMLEKLKLDQFNKLMLNIYPIFESNIISIAKQTIIIYKTKYDYKYEWIIEQFMLWGVKIKKINYKIYNKYKFYINILKNFLSITYYKFLYKKNINFEELINYSSNTDKIFLLNIKNILENDINSYIKKEILEEENLKNLNEFINDFKLILDLFLNKKDIKITKIFIDIKKLIKFKLNYINKMNKLLINSIDIYK